MIELRRREHVRSAGVTLRQRAEVSVRRERCEFTGGRDDVADGRGSRLFAGADGDVAAPEPAWAVDPAEVEERLRDFAGWTGGQIVLRHQVVATGRAVAVGFSAARRSVCTVFALTGETVTGNGKTLPIGISGRGTGLDVLTSRALAETIAATRSALATAGGTVRGSPPAVLRPQAAAVLVHEGVGHYAEAMHVGAPAVHRLFTRVAAECLSVQDEPTSEADGGRYDDEGVLSLGPTQVVRQGVLVAQLHSRATAQAAGCASTGNARAAQVWDPPIPRMRTVVCVAGSRPEEALVEELGSGIYIHRLAHGYRQGTTVAADVVLGEYVDRGRRTGRYFTG
jgi:TldD protein